MLIRSQDKKRLINLNSTSVIRIQDLFGAALNFGILVDGMSIGEYSTEEKALKVLDKIENSYIGTLYTDGNKIVATRVCFEMPQDNEV